MAVLQALAAGVALLPKSLILLLGPAPSPRHALLTVMVGALEGMRDPARPLKASKLAR